MAWNCLGMEDAGKRTLLQNYIAANNIDLVVLQEGSQGFVGAVSEATYAPAYLLDATSTEDKVLSCAFKKGDFAPANAGLCLPMLTSMGGVSRSAYYNVVPNAAHPVGATLPLDVDYFAEPRIKKYIQAPVQAALKSVKSTANLEFKTKGRAGFVNSGDKAVRDRIENYIVKPVQKRINLTGYRRPKVLRIPAWGGGAGLTIYFWHAPLGRELTLGEVGLSGSDELAAEVDAGGGQVALAANRLFAKYLGIDTATPFPARTVLMGDLNISRKAVKLIYNVHKYATVVGVRGLRMVSSADGWCHAVVGDGMLLNALVTRLDVAALGHSDHDPIVFETIP
jgi:hypothetical protein